MDAVRGRHPAGGTPTQERERRAEAVGSGVVPGGGTVSKKRPYRYLTPTPIPEDERFGEDGGYLPG